MAHSRTARLLELLGLVQARTRFTADELAREVGVSRRTILRDLQTLEALGVALEAKPGPGGGYRVPWGRRRLALSFSLDEALALVLGYDAMRTHPAMQVTTLTDHAITKVRAALPADVAADLSKQRKHLALHTPDHIQSVPCFKTLLDAAMAGQAVSITYESISAAPHSRTVRPVGLYVDQGLWYCACREHNRDFTLRADRISTAEILDESGVFVETLSEWLARRREASATTTVRARLSASGAKRHELQPLFDRARWRTCQNDWWEIEVKVEATDMAYWASRFMALGTDALVIAPDILVAKIYEQSQALVEAYKPYRA